MEDNKIMRSVQQMNRLQHGENEPVIVLKQDRYTALLWFEAEYNRLRTEIGEIFEDYKDVSEEDIKICDRDLACWEFIEREA